MNFKLLVATSYDGDGNRVFQLNYNPEAECGYGMNVSGEIFMPEHSQNEDESLTAEGQLFSYICSKTGRTYELTEYVNDINREHTEVLTAYNINTNFDTESYSYAGTQRVSNNSIWNEARNVDHNEMSYYLYDGRGSVTAKTWYNGMVTNAYQYDPYGQVTLGSTEHTDFYGYNAESYNPNTGLEYLRARYYNVEQGRFFQEDTYLGNITDPLTLNRYAYVKNSPMNYQDPSGHKAMKSLKDIANWIGNGYEQTKQAAQNILFNGKLSLNVGNYNISTKIQRAENAGKTLGCEVAELMASTFLGIVEAVTTNSAIEDIIDNETGNTAVTLKSLVIDSPELSSQHQQLMSAIAADPGATMTLEEILKIVVGAIVATEAAAVSTTFVVFGVVVVVALTLTSSSDQAIEEPTDETKAEEDSKKDPEAHLPDNTIDAGKKGSKSWNDAKKKIKNGRGKGINTKTNSQEDAEKLLNEARPNLEKKPTYSKDGKSGYEIHPAEPDVGNVKPHIKWWDWSNGKSNGAEGHIYFD